MNETAMKAYKNKGSRNSQKKPKAVQKSKNKQPQAFLFYNHKGVIKK
jgi:hypothetical protein